ncbi:L-threonylcarbamoyladenylate synthase [Melioribacter sp. OK-6-Me]|uniref:L-threonylcarbamoyladenylate synthase n=1 Tax=unclassified Melioribacter TaxID=2627329 RepID=UPI003ED985B9
MPIYKYNDKSLHKAAELIKNGELVAFPTETVYGLGADGLNPIAVAKIFEKKNRPSFNPLILHIADKTSLKNYVYYDEPIIDKLIDKFWPGPLTLVLPKKKSVPDIVTSGNDTVAIRMPNNEIALKLIRLSQRPIAAPSANRFGHLSPTDAEHVKKSLGDDLFILDGGKCAIGLESTIIGYKNGAFLLLRPGGIPVDDIEEITGHLTINDKNDSAPESPGQLPFHYSPEIPLFIINKSLLSDKVFLDSLKNKKVGLLLFKDDEIATKLMLSNYSKKILSASGNMAEAAANFFKFLHDFEIERVDLILAEAVEPEGLGLAIMDRLKRAAKRYKS